MRKKPKELIIKLRLRGPDTNIDLDIPYIDEDEYRRDSMEIFDLALKLSKNRAFICPLCNQRSEAGQDCNCPGMALANP